MPHYYMMQVGLRPGSGALKTETSPLILYSEMSYAFPDSFLITDGKGLMHLFFSPNEQELLVVTDRFGLTN